MRVILIDSPIFAPPSEGRTPGIHVSRVISSIASEAGILRKGQGPAGALDLVEMGGLDEDWWADLTVADRLRIHIGLAWESWYLPHYRDKSGEGIVVHPAELHHEGIFLTPDGESVDFLVSEREPESGYCLALHECKATYKSTNTVGMLSAQWLWLAQTQAYCKALGCTRAYLHVLFLCGDYKYPISPNLGPQKGSDTIYRIDYTPEEIAKTWDLLKSYVAHRRAMEAEGPGGPKCDEECRRRWDRNSAMKCRHGLALDTL